MIGLFRGGHLFLKLIERQNSNPSGRRNLTVFSSRPLLASSISPGCHLQREAVRDQSATESLAEEIEMTIQSINLTELDGV
jgi:hypothetical protein